MSYIQLTKSVASIPQGYGTYALKHATGGIYFGSTLDLPQRLMNWYYALDSKTTPLPSRVTKLVDVQGRNPLDWSYQIIERGNPPAGYKPKASLINKPEWAYVQWLQANAPLLVLNEGTGKGGRPAGTPTKWGPGGISPLKYLNVMLGVHRGHRWPAQPPCFRAVDTRTLSPMGELTAMPFAGCLHRSMNAPPRHFNPSPAAIDELYQLWKRAQPAGFEAAVALPGTITTAGEALSLPDPSVWLAAHPAAQPAKVIAGPDRAAANEGQENEEFVEPDMGDIKPEDILP